VNTHESEQFEEESADTGDDFMHFVAALVRTHHQLPSATDTPARRTLAKSPKRAAARHEPGASYASESRKA